MRIHTPPTCHLHIHMQDIYIAKDTHQPYRWKIHLFTEHTDIHIDYFVNQHYNLRLSSNTYKLTVYTITILLPLKFHNYPFIPHVATTPNLPEHCLFSPSLCLTYPLIIITVCPSWPFLYLLAASALLGFSQHLLLCRPFVRYLHQPCLRKITKDERLLLDASTNV